MLSVKGWGVGGGEGQVGLLLLVSGNFVCNGLFVLTLVVLGRHCSVTCDYIFIAFFGVFFVSLQCASLVVQ